MELLFQVQIPAEITQLNTAIPLLIYIFFEIIREKNLPFSFSIPFETV